MKADNLNNRRLLILVSSNGVAGAESRAVKVAAYFAKEGIFKEVVFVANKELLQKYKNSKVLASLLFDSNIKIIEKNKNDYFLFANERLNGKITKQYLNSLFSKGKRCKSIYRKLLLLFSWERFLKKTIQEGDIVQGIYGHTIKIALYHLSQKLNNCFIAEITSPTLINTDQHYLNAAFLPNKRANKLNLIAVTKTNHDIYLKAFKPSFFSAHNINLSYYEGPFVSIPQKVDPTVHKENIVIFPHRFFGRKNAPLFAKVINQMMNRGELLNWKVLFRGSGRDEIKVREILNKHIVDGKIEIGYSTNIADDFAKSKICVSIISTDNTSSNSIYESLKHGNLQILSDTGNTRKALNHPDLFYCDLSTKSICNAIRAAVSIAESKSYMEKSDNMRNYYKYLENNNLYVKKAISVYNHC